MRVKKKEVVSLEYQTFLYQMVNDVLWMRWKFTAVNS